jgi:hypothetical protein
VCTSLTSPNSIFEDSAHGVADTINACEEEASTDDRIVSRGRGSLAIIVLGLRMVGLLRGLEAYS